MKKIHTINHGSVKWKENELAVRGKRGQREKLNDGNGGTVFFLFSHTIIFYLMNTNSCTVCCIVQVCSSNSFYDDASINASL